MAYLFFALVTLHVLGVVIWIGGSFFVYALLPSPGTEADRSQMELWLRGLKRFFPWLLLSSLVVFGTGEALAREWLGGLDGPLYVHIMFAIGALCLLYSFYIYLFPYRRMKALLAAGDHEQALWRLRFIRGSLGLIGLAGLINVVVAASGPVWGGSPLELAPYLPFLA